MATASPMDYDAGAPTLDALPLETLLCILSYLETRDVGSCAMAGRALAHACDDRSLWTRLYEREQTRQEERWRAAATPVAAAVSLCSDWTDSQVRKGKHRPDYILAEIVDDIVAVVRSPWHASIDLVRLLGHPRFACAARAHVRVLVDSFEGPSSRETTAPVGRPPYASVGTIIRCAGARYRCRSRVMIQHGFFDADAILCGPGLTHFHWHHGDVPHATWLGCAGSWYKGSVSACDQDGNAVYEDGRRYRGGLRNGFCHGRGRIYDSDSTVLISGQWRRNLAHGSCSWLQKRYESGTIQTWVANAHFDDGTIAGPIAYFAGGRLIMRIPRPYPRRPLVNFVAKCAFVRGTDDGWPRLPNYTTVRYGPSGVTIASDTCLAHRWAADGALTLCTVNTRIYPSTCVPGLLVVSACNVGAPYCAPLLITLGSQSTFTQDPRTFVVTMRAGQSVDARYHAIVNREPADATITPPGLEPDAGTTDAHLQDMVCDDHDDRTDATCADDHDLSQENFVHVIASKSPARIGVDQADESDMSDDVRAVSVDLLHFLDTATAPPLSAVLCAQPRPLRGGRVRNALYVASSTPTQKTSDVDMSHCSLRGCVVAGAKWKGCDFRHARFERCVFYDCSFERCAFFGATFSDTQFEACQFVYSHLPDSHSRFTVGTDGAKVVLGALGAIVSTRE
ncbi:F-box domain containing protein [Pandoravirus neocaledonia]|uniref:F-box domain containing protein n=1 Tax=Pandoravirus neocaledonia TaxID=2107708 RepID=A0A2U7UCK1_9VIRU|nr:F-box domain containing protein [Pandoravirus neocaledonia]AVK76122.1 F-box domain containing protein [Pandoravirus neocaledonia]